jgi:hypothetical protein
VAVYELLIGSTAALGVWIFYRVLETSFPETYFRSASLTDPIVNRTLPRYAMWRLLPVFAGAATATISADRQGEAIALTAGAFWLGHIFSTVGIALLTNVRRHVWPRPIYVAMYVAIVVATGAATAAGALLRTAVAPAVPTPDVLLQSLWLGGFAALIAAFLAKTFESSRSTAALVKRSRSELSEELLTAARDEALDRGTDPRIVEAIMITENLQRPAWVRRIEATSLARRLGATTHGVMQVSATTSLSDVSSVSEATERYLKGLQIPGWNHDGEIHRNGWDVVDSLRDYNDSDAWQSLLSDVLEQLLPLEGQLRVMRRQYSSTAFAADDQPIIHVTEMELTGPSAIRVLGTALLGDDLLLLQVNGAGQPVEETTWSPTTSEREEFEIRLRLHPGTVAITGEPRGRTTDRSALTPAFRIPVPFDWRVPAYAVAPTT